MLGEQKKRLDFAMHCRFVLHTHVCIPISSFARFAVHQETCSRFFRSSLLWCCLHYDQTGQFVTCSQKRESPAGHEKASHGENQALARCTLHPQERFGRSTWSSHRSNQVEVYTLRPFESGQRGHRQASGTGQTPHRHDRRHLSQMWKRHALQTHQVPR